MKFIHKKFQVKEEDLQKTYKLGQAKRGWKFDPSTDNIFFIGLRGSGKSTVGQAIAQDLGMSFVDTDENFVNMVGKSIEDFVKEHGWDKFREVESKILEEVCREKGQVVATGGGIVLNEKNRELIKKSGFVFYLMCTIPTLEQRILSDKKNKNRPPLTEKSLNEELITCLREREPLYLTTSHFIVSAEKPVDEIKEDVYLFLGVKK